MLNRDKKDVTDVEIVMRLIKVIKGLRLLKKDRRDHQWENPPRTLCTQASLLDLKSVSAGV